MHSNSITFVHLLKMNKWIWNKCRNHEESKKYCHVCVKPIDVDRFVSHSLFTLSFWMRTYEHLCLSVMDCTTNTNNTAHGTVEKQSVHLWNSILENERKQINRIAIIQKKKKQLKNVCYCRMKSDFVAREYMNAMTWDFLYKNPSDSFRLLSCCSDCILRW